MTSLDAAGRITEATLELAQLAAEAAELASQQETSSALVAAASFDPEQTRVDAVRLRAQSLAKVAQIAAVQKRLQLDLESQMAKARAALAPLQQQAAQLGEVLEAVEAMLGVGEQVVVLRDGQPAAAGTPLTIRQDVRAMDEECRIAAADGGLDVRMLEQFDAWLLADPAHLDQVLPEPRGIVGLVVRRSDRDYRGMDSWSAAQLNEANKRADMLLIRNGERLLIVTSRLGLGQRLLPNASDFEDLFAPVDARTGERVRLQPGSYAWKQAEESADRTRRSFLKVALLLQGLAQRSTAFHPLPASGLDLLDPSPASGGTRRRSRR